ncbi:hypothetical protein Tco_0430356, partial [Tanacetum coccineum]
MIYELTLPDSLFCCDPNWGCYIKVHDEQQQKTSGTYEGTGTIPGVPDVPPYEYESDKESWGDSEDEDNDADNGDSNDHDDDSDDERTKSDR